MLPVAQRDFRCRKSFRAAGKFRRVFAARDGSNLEGLCHRWIYVQEFDKIIDSGAKTETHRGFMNDFSRAIADHRNAKNFLRSRVCDHLDYASRVSDSAGSRHERQWDAVAPTGAPRQDRFLFSHANSRYLRIGENRAWNNAVIDAAQLSVCKCIVR